MSLANVRWQIKNPLSQLDMGISGLQLNKPNQFRLQLCNEVSLKEPKDLIYRPETHLRAIEKLGPNKQRLALINPLTPVVPTGTYIFSMFYNL